MQAHTPMDSPSKHIDEASDRIFTAANVISFLRLCLIPFCIWFMACGQDVAATVFFAVAALTDFVDGQVARRTHTVSKLGKLMDPAIDTLLMITGVLGTFLLGRLPAWVMILIFARELFLLIGGYVLLHTYRIQIPVIYPGKFATTFLFIGFAALILGMPLLPGLAITDLAWLPGFNASPTSFGIWFIYLGLALQIGVTVYYARQALRALRARTDTDHVHA